MEAGVGGEDTIEDDRVSFLGRQVGLCDAGERKRRGGRRDGESGLEATAMKNDGKVKIVVLRWRNSGPVWSTPVQA
ncbi:hypothetical protein HPP92_014465 [Vanilla planifolia]|uniref:Uncharacterized protein n=1 Tax=Vanilla planifolia TaxID=51239 RepID=A0A835QQ38_VANPL|nr:hypothetical protein HPP92_014465 [Vanilla planifolia]